MVIASDHKSAKLYAELLAGHHRHAPVVVLSDDPGASKKIADFEASDDRWLVAVRMVSEGVDIPRLAVGVYATSVQTPLFFAQAVGRFVRDPAAGGDGRGLPAERARCCSRWPPRWRPSATTPSTARPRSSSSPTSCCAANREERDGEDEPGFIALQASAHLDRVIYDGGEYGTGAAVGSEDEQDFLGLPGLLAPDQVAVLLQQHQAKQLKQRPRRAGTGAAGADRPSRCCPRLRKELNGLVGAWHHRTGKPHGGDPRRAARRPAAARRRRQATGQQLQDRIETMRRWARERRR